MGKAERKIGQVYRKEFRDRLKSEFSLLQKVIKKRPRFIPRFLWQLGLAIYIKKEAVEDI